jgi:hypothetical protein
MHVTHQAGTNPTEEPGTRDCDPQQVDICMSGKKGFMRRKTTTKLDSGWNQSVRCRVNVKSFSLVVVWRESLGVLLYGAEVYEEKVRHGNLIQESMGGVPQGRAQSEVDNGNSKARWEVAGRSFSWCVEHTVHKVKKTGGDLIKKESIGGFCGNYWRVRLEGAKLDHSRLSDATWKCHGGVLGRTMEIVWSFWGASRWSFWSVAAQIPRGLHVEQPEHHRQ